MKKNKKNEKHLKLIKSYKKLSFDEQSLFMNELDKEQDRQLQYEYEFLTNLDTRARVSQEMMRILKSDGTPYFNAEWIAKNIMGFDEEEVKELEKTSKKLKNSK